MMLDKEIELDPRTGSFKVIWTRMGNACAGVGARKGDWRWSGGGFADHATGNFIPAAAVIFAQREA